MLKRIVPTWSNSTTEPGASVLALIENTSWSGRSKGTSELRFAPSASSQSEPSNLAITPTSGAGSPSALSSGPGAPLGPKLSGISVSLMAVVWLPEWKAAA